MLALDTELRKTIQEVFGHWANRDRFDAFAQQREKLMRLLQELEQHVERLTNDNLQPAAPDQAVVGFFAITGAVRGLVAAMANAQTAIKQIDWPQWSAARF